MLEAVEARVLVALGARQERQRAEQGLQSYRRRLILSGGVIPNANRMGAYEDQAKLAHEQLTRAVNQLEDWGLELRDLDRGLVDFPTRYRGQTVYLCYQIGEREVRYWHSQDSGFAGRQLIDETFLAEHQGGSPGDAVC